MNERAREKTREEEEGGKIHIFMRITKGEKNNEERARERKQERKRRGKNA